MDNEQDKLERNDAILAYGLMPWLETDKQKISEKKQPIPKELYQYLSRYGPQIYDAWSGEPIGWGFKIIKRMPLKTKEFGMLQTYGDVEHIHFDPTAVENPSHEICLGSLERNFFIIDKWLTIDEAIEKYGPIIDEWRGPFEDDFRSITFGNTTFMSKHLDPLGDLRKR